MSERDEGPLSGTGVNEGNRRPGLDEQVCEALAAHSDVDASQIGVAIDSATGDVVLFGTVPTGEQRRLAEDCATSIRGVSVVYNRLVVGRCMDGSEPDGSGDDADDPVSAEPAGPPK
jgi:hypothetical protein